MTCERKSQPQTVLRKLQIHKAEIQVTPLVVWMFFYIPDSCKQVNGQGQRDKNKHGFVAILWVILFLLLRSGRSCLVGKNACCLPVRDAMKVLEWGGSWWFGLVNWVVSHSTSARTRGSNPQTNPNHQYEQMPNF